MPAVTADYVTAIRTAASDPDTEGTRPTRRHEPSTRSEAVHPRAAPDVDPASHRRAASRITQQRRIDRILPITDRQVTSEAHSGDRRGTPLDARYRSHPHSVKGFRSIEHPRVIEIQFLDAHEILALP